MECHVDGCNGDRISVDSDDRPVCKKHWMDFLRGRGAYADGGAEPAQPDIEAQGIEVEGMDEMADSGQSDLAQSIAERNRDAYATDAAIELANENLIDLSMVEGSGAMGRDTYDKRILKRDVKRVIE